MRGMTHGLLGFAAFLATVGATLVQLGIVASFSLALAVVVVVQAVELRSAFKLHDETGTIDDVLLEVAD
jgi:negative regulator of sigma E activity